MLKKKITFLFVAIIGILTIALQSCNDNGSGGLPPEPTLADTLIGNWKLIKLTGGGLPERPAYESSILEILNQNQDLSFNYKWWFADTLFSEGQLVIADDGKIVSNIFSLDYKKFYYDKDVLQYQLFRFYKKENLLYMEITKNMYDASLFHYNKIDGGPNE